MKRAIVLMGVLGVSACGVVGVKGGPTETLRKVVELDTSASTRVKITMGGGELQLKGGAAALLEADFSFNVPEWKPSVTHRSSAAEGELEITQDTRTSAIGQTENRWQLALNDSMPLSLEAHVGAGTVQMALGSLTLRDVELHLGAGEINVDLRGQPKQSYKVSINGGVGSATVRLPASVAISASASGGIGSINVDGLEKRDGRWMNPKVPSGPVTIELDVQGGVGEIKIVAE